MRVQPFRVLFVDDEPRVLQALERLMLDADEPWLMATAVDGHDALATLERAPYAVVVTDMRMPGMDGATLLAHVRERHPEVVRVILSGQTSREAALEGIRVAHRFLSKPCRPDVLRDVIDRTARVLRSLGDRDARRALSQLGPLPSPPAIHRSLLALAVDETVSAAALCEVVRQDPALVAKVLQIANSAYFRRSGTPVLELRDAVVRIGARALASLALVEGVFCVGGDAVLDLEALRRRRFETAELAMRLVAPGPPRDDAFTAALLADVGLLALAAAPSPDLRRKLRVVRHGDAEAERAAFGATHAELGAYLLELWGFPFRIVEAVASHHTPDSIPRHDALTAAAVHVADAIVAGETPCREIRDAYRFRTESLPPARP